MHIVCPRGTEGLVSGGVHAELSRTEHMEDVLCVFDFWPNMSTGRDTSRQQDEIGTLDMGDMGSIGDES
jgi:hypothetical protein